MRERRPMYAYSCFSFSFDSIFRSAGHADPECRVSEIRVRVNRQDTYLSTMSSKTLSNCQRRSTACKRAAWTRCGRTCIEWLCLAFGFERLLVAPGDGGTIAHVQLTFGRGMIMLGSARDDAFGKLVTTPDRTGGVGTQRA